MEKENLLENEVIIKELSSRNEELCLTNKRIRYDYASADKKRSSGVFLSDVSYISVDKIQYVIFLILGIIAAIFTIYSYFEHGSNEMFVEGLTLTTVFLILYFFTKKQFLIIASSGGKIKFFAKGLNSDDFLEFMELVEKTKNDSVQN